MLEKVQSDRLAKLEKIRQLGIDPYGRRYDTAEAIGGILGRFQDDTEGQTADAAGRLILIRDMGKMIFAHIRDETASMQIALRKNALDETSWKLAGLLDLGDIIAVSGPLHRTKTGEVTIWADKLTLLCKSLNPMPEKFHGLQDVQMRYRQRYLDLMANPESMTAFKKRIAIIEHFRTVLRGKGFVEVETPMMQAIYGGAAARPFVTHHNALDVDLFMRISPELYLKRLLVGGMGKVFEINRNFRNEGLDTRHNPEFTMMELYQAYADYNVMMDITEELITESARLMPTPQQIADESAEAFRASNNKDVNFQPDGYRDICPETKQLESLLNEDRRNVALSDAGRLVVRFGDKTIDYTRPWQRSKYADLLKKYADVDMCDLAAVRKKARECGIEEANKDDAVVINEIFEALVEPALAELDENGMLKPVFVIDYPADLCPLTRRKADAPTIAERFELYIAGMEIANAYTELNDPAVQEENFRRQLRGEAENETMRVMDEDFITSLRHGMPPAGGLGIGIDRVVMLLTNTLSIRDVVLFPMLRPQEGKS